MNATITSATGSDRINGVLHNSAVVRHGFAEKFERFEKVGEVEGVEIAFTREPHGNMRWIAAIDMDAARSLRDQLTAILEAE